MQNKPEDKGCYPFETDEEIAERIRIQNDFVNEQIRNQEHEQKYSTRD